ncbi:DNA recombination protein RmuC, partial [bacterium]|nr:DNA recombination protein RmuC [bacterium]
MQTTVIVISALIIGFITGIFIKSQEISRLSCENNDLKNKNEALQDKVLNLTKEVSIDKTNTDNLEEFQKFVKDNFKEIANEVIKEEQKDLREQNKEVLEEKIKPLKENFDKFKEKVEEFNKQGEVQTVTIKTQIETLMNESREIQHTANKLSNAINANAKVRGNFGEIILENILQQAGLVNIKDDKEKGNYITQTKFEDIQESTETFPDAVVFFPDSKHIIIDSKCPLNNFVEYCNSDNEEEKEKQLNLFYNSVEKMIEDLGKKYNSLKDLNTPEFKLMFIPL